jgi:hypothetical protein
MIVGFLIAASWSNRAQSQKSISLTFDTDNAPSDRGDEKQRELVGWYRED